MKSSGKVGLGSIKIQLNFEGNLDPRSCFFKFLRHREGTVHVCGAESTSMRNHIFIAGHALRWEIPPRETPTSACVLGLGGGLNCPNSY